MNRAGLLLGIASGALSLAISPTAWAQAALPALAPTLQAQGPSKPLTAWLDLCHRAPEECVADPAEPTRIQLTPSIWADVRAVNKDVNARIRPVVDRDHWGVTDHWDVPRDGKGDCEDYQLLKRRLLIERGLPRRALRMTVVLDELQEGHAVLVLRTDRGDYVLDNKRSDVLPWPETGYLFVKQEAASGQAWVSLGGINGPVATANPQRKRE